MDVEAHIQQLHRDGYTVIEDFCDAATLAAIRRGLAPHMSQHRGRNDFEGFETERVYTLVARGKVFEQSSQPFDVGQHGICQVGGGVVAVVEVHLA